MELGFPFSDPLLDGPVIQAANNRALNAGHSTEDSFKLLAKVRSKYPEIPISLLLCANLIFAKGLDNFYQRCAEVGVDAVLVADIPLLAKEDYVQAAKKHGIQPCLLYTSRYPNNLLQFLLILQVLHQYLLNVVRLLCLFLL